ncbi:MAG: phosphopantothenoylcysteine decarboxylase/phosphopantothenate--cysteine ligase [Myxococcota bacterium]|jgi:phosphopantothenoylcysteine decarboxylase/phosphopantothenate--cysteine ligase
MDFAEKKILLGVTGGIAAYKAAELARLLFKAGADVHACMTPSATKFISPLTLEALTGNPVRSEIFSLRNDSSIAHTELGRGMDAAVIAPATADFLGRLAGGLADQLLLNVLMASTMPVLLCPSMNANMWDNPLVQANITRLRAIPRYSFVDPDAGWLACRVVGRGRLPDPPDIAARLARLLTPQDLAGKHVVVSAGPTREWIDPVRFLSNPSTGKMGYAIAEAAWSRGARVTLVSGPSTLETPLGCERVDVETTADLKSAVDSALSTADVLIMAAAPADWRPIQRHTQKQKKRTETQSVELTRTEDVLMGASTSKPAHCVIVGFAAETQQLLENAGEKARKKGVDLLFVNRVGSEAKDTGFGAATNAGVILNGEGQPVAELPVASKRVIADGLLDAVVGLRSTTIPGVTT